ncbi:HupE/UreJ family protein [Variovorax robiniae]|uniref:HupE/UreJ family protein n=1 Tax=Variovorax robiniae TaxID=1836199 RepID=A0ABU8X2Y2_9BURK
MKRWIVTLFTAALAVLCTPALAHKASDAYLQLSSADGILHLRWDVSLRDLDAVLDLDRNEDQKLSWGEVRGRMDDIRTYALAHLRLQEGRCTLTEAQPTALESRVDGSYLVLQLRSPCELAGGLRIDYSLFREVDPTHRGLLRIDRGDGQALALQSLDPAAGAVTVSLALPGSGSPNGEGNGHGDSPSSRSGGATFFLDGIHHILIGYDHILFLISLLLPAVLVRSGGKWRPVAQWQQAVWPIVSTVTMFTLGHSITLALAGLQIVSLSPRLIEPAIALTIIVAAVDNIVPLLRGRRRIFTFLFGLIHGFGFANVLAELDLPVKRFVTALLEFNLGVEAGQLIVVSIALSVLLALRWQPRYPPLVLRGGSAFAMGIAAIWFVERVFDLKVLPV